MTIIAFLYKQKYRCHRCVTIMVLCDDDNDDNDDDDTYKKYKCHRSETLIGLLYKQL